MQTQLDLTQVPSGSPVKLEFPEPPIFSDYESRSSLDSSPYASTVLHLSRFVLYPRVSLSPPDSKLWSHTHCLGLPRSLVL